MGTGTLINLHTHTRFSDGDFAPEEIVEAAVEAGLTHIAITDHFDTKKCSSMPRQSLTEYIRHIDRVRRAYADRITVLAGVEIDTVERRCELSTLPFDELNRLDLVLIEYVNDRGRGGLPVQRLEELVSNFRIPVGMAHTNFPETFPEWSPEDLADLLGSLGVYVELNSAVPYRIGGRRFYELSDAYYRAFASKVKVAVGTDTHHHLSRVGKVEHPYHFIRALGLEEDLLL